MSDRKRDPLLYSKLYCQHCLLLLLALFCYWHHCDIGITGAQFCALQNAQYSHKERKVYREYGAFV